jgi:transcriptional regulator with XRE-family HTH domain
LGYYPSRSQRITQKELAEKMGVKEQQVQPDEANQYSYAGFQRLIAVAQALNIL